MEDTRKEELVTEPKFGKNIGVHMGKYFRGMSSDPGARMGLGCLSILIAIFVPFFILIFKPDYYNALTQFVFSVLLLWAAYWMATIDKQRDVRTDAIREVSNRWLPAAEIASTTLVTISLAIERLKRDHIQQCHDVDKYVKSSEGDLSDQTKQIIQHKCTETAKSLESLRHQVENGIATWRVFIEKNCDGSDCDDIFQHIDQMRERQSVGIDGDPYGQI